MKHAITGVILAGGQGRRLGYQNKGLIAINGVPLVEYVLARLIPQVAQVVINTNTHQETYRHYGYPVIDDGDAHYAGPLSGARAALPLISTEWLLTVPCDCPSIPSMLGHRLHAQAIAQNRLIATVHDGERLQPVFSLLHRRVLPDLIHYLAQDPRPVVDFFRQVGFVAVDFADVAPSFLNLNTPEDVANFSQQNIPPNPS